MYFPLSTRFRRRWRLWRIFNVQTTSFLSVLFLWWTEVVTITVAADFLHTPQNTSGVFSGRSKISLSDILDGSHHCLGAVQLCTPAELEPIVVCGSDGKTYRSVCEIRKSICQGNPVQIVHNGSPCPEKSKCFSERALQLEQANTRNITDAFVAECEADGAYSSVQCHRTSGYCWCVTNTGRPIPTTSVQFKRPNCLPQGKVGRRSSRRRLGTRRRGCSTADRSTFSSNLVKIFRSDYEKDPENQLDARENTKEILLSQTAKIIDWKFVKLDKNDDGKISAKESVQLRRYIRENLQPRPCANRFAKYCDFNKDKLITRSEWSVCLGVDINVSFRLFQSLNTSDENEPHSGAEVETSTVSRTSPTKERRPHQRQKHAFISNSDDGFSLQSQPQRQQAMRSSNPAARGANALLQASRSVLNTGIESAGFGLRERSDVGEPDEPLDCQSQRRRALADHENTPGSGIYIPKCTSTDDGRRYERLQCHEKVGYCWCADPDTGKPIQGTAAPISRKLDCDVVGPVGQRPKLSNGADMWEIKGCPPIKQRALMARLHATFESSMIATGNDREETNMNRREMAIRWKFATLDKNKNEVLERKEWRPYRLELKTWKNVKRCGRNFLRSCDVDGDKRITLNEWLRCALNTSREPLRLGRKRVGPNPFRDILDPDQ